MNPIVEAVRLQVEKTKTVMGSAKVLIGGIKDRIAAAVAAALQNGATEEQLAPFTDLNVALTTETDGLAAAVEANTP